jgi:uncharacterized protein
MLIDDIKKANIAAMKAHDADSRTALSIVISKYLELKTNGSGKEVTDADAVAIVKKVDKELDEEKSSFAQAGRTDSVAALDKQKAALAPFIPQQMSEADVRKIYATLSDKSMPAVMKFFKEKYSGKVDMSLVSKIARGL